MVGVPKVVSAPEVASFEFGIPCAPHLRSHGGDLLAQGRGEIRTQFHDVIGILPTIGELFA
jgi:hypothetical protein